MFNVKGIIEKYIIRKTSINATLLVNMFGFVSSDNDFCYIQYVSPAMDVNGYGFSRLVVFLPNGILSQHTSVENLINY